MLAARIVHRVITDFARCDTAEVYLANMVVEGVVSLIVALGMFWSIKSTGEYLEEHWHITVLTPGLS